jgi:hypothetical protein
MQHPQQQRCLQGRREQQPCSGRHVGSGRKQSVVVRATASDIRKDSLTRGMGVSYNLEQAW